MAVEPLIIEGTAYTIDELEAILGPLEPPYDIEELQRLVSESQEDSSEALAALLAALLAVAVTPRLQPRQIVYSVRDRAYYQGGRPLTEGQLRRRIFAEQQRNSMRYRRRTQELIDGRISFDQWQDEMTRDLIRSHFRMAQAGAGGAPRLTPDHLRRLRNGLREEFRHFRKFADDLANGRLSEKMALHRAGRYGAGSGKAYSQSEQASHPANEWVARRQLTYPPHCPDCPNYETEGWVPADKVVPVASRCVCTTWCKCVVFYRRRQDVNPADIDETYDGYAIARRSLSDKLPTPQL
jgi:hypothetical protein